MANYFSINVTSKGPIPENNLSSGSQKKHSLTPLEEVFSSIQSLAAKQQPLTTGHIIKWYSVLAEQGGNPTNQDLQLIQTKLTPYIHTLNENLATLKTRSYQSKAQLIAKSVYEFEHLHLFPTRNRQIAQLIAGYISSYLKLPMMKFKEEEEDNYQQHSESIEQMTQLISKKIREVIFDPMGNECYLQQSFSNAGSYHCPKTGKTRTVEWDAF